MKTNYARLNLLSLKIRSKNAQGVKRERDFESLIANIVDIHYAHHIEKNVKLNSME